MDSITLQLGEVMKCMNHYEVMKCRLWGGEVKLAARLNIGFEMVLAGSAGRDSPKSVCVCVCVWTFSKEVKLVRF